MANTNTSAPSTMNLTIPHEDLVAFIRRQAKLALDARQVGARLRDLLESRLEQLKTEYEGAHTPAEALRLAYVDQRYLKAVDEATAVSANALEARIQYDTYTMLLQARRSLRPFRAAGLREPRPS